MTHSLDRFSLTALVVAGLSLAGPRPAAAQTQAADPPPLQPPLQGVVVDEATYQPLQSATVTIVGTDLQVTTGRWGSFAFPDAPTGQVGIHVSAPGHPSVVQHVEVTEGRVVFMRVVLPSVAAVLAELLVKGTPRAQTSEVARTAADLLALEVPRARISSGVVGKSDYQLRLRPSTTIMGNGAPLILIDGVVMSNDDSAYDALERIPASNVAEIEVLKGPAAAFLYPFAANGVVNVKTKRGARDR
jgi:outer membrane receptor protein involved in Fe transport